PASSPCPLRPVPRRAPGPAQPVAPARRAPWTCRPRTQQRRACGVAVYGLPFLFSPKESDERAVARDAFTRLSARQRARRIPSAALVGERPPGPRFPAKAPYGDV